LQNPRVHRGDHVHGGVQLFFGHPRFPCVRKAPLHSRIAKPHHGDRETDQHFLPLGETFHGMGIAIKSSKVSFLRRHQLIPFARRWAFANARRLPSRFRTRDKKVSYIEHPAAL
jgi:hypothetical protein